MDARSIVGPFSLGGSELGHGDDVPSLCIERENEFRSTLASVLQLLLILIAGISNLVARFFLIQIQCVDVD